jgi:hypothetical protein
MRNSKLRFVIPTPNAVRRCISVENRAAARNIAARQARDAEMRFARREKDGVCGAGEINMCVVKIFILKGFLNIIFIFLQPEINRGTVLFRRP